METLARLTLREISSLTTSCQTTTTQSLLMALPSETPHTLSRTQLLTNSSKPCSPIQPTHCYSPPRPSQQLQQLLPRLPELSVMLPQVAVISVSALIFFQNYQPTPLSLSNSEIQSGGKFPSKVMSTTTPTLLLADSESSKVVHLPLF